MSWLGVTSSGRKGCGRDAIGRNSPGMQTGVSWTAAIAQPGNVPDRKPEEDEVVHKSTELEAVFKNPHPRTGARRDFSLLAGASARIAQPSGFWPSAGGAPSSWPASAFRWQFGGSLARGPQLPEVWL